MKTLLIALLLLPHATLPAAPQAAGQRSARRVVEIAAERFEFFPAEITLDQGDEVEFRITSEDTVHGFRIVGAGVNLAVPKRGRGEAVASFSAATPGRYTFECNRMCGAGHNFMRGTIIVRGRVSGAAAR
jgi:heme/copper-type cytochrome/quinol oxidase subunit 2